MSEAIYEIIPGSVRHIRALSNDARPAACMTLRQFGSDPRRALHHAFVQSQYVRTAMIGGKPAAMWGTGGNLLSQHAYIWATIGMGAVRYPLAVVRRARKELAELCSDGLELRATVIKEDDRALLFAETIGFRASDEFAAPEGMLSMKFAVLT